MNFDHELDFDLDDPLPQTEKTWAKYVQGVGLILEQSGYRLQRSRSVDRPVMFRSVQVSARPQLSKHRRHLPASLSGYEIEGNETREDRANGRA